MVSFPLCHTLEPRLRKQFIAWLNQKGARSCTHGPDVGASSSWFPRCQNPVLLNNISSMYPVLAQLPFYAVYYLRFPP